jgi:hypothetical protein
MADTLLFVQSQPYSLAGAGSSIADTTIILSSFKTIDAVDLAMTDFGDIGYGTLEPNNGTSEEQISFTGITQNANGTATLTGVKTVLMLSPYTETSGLAKSHIGGAKFVISNTAGFYNKMTSKDNDETITGLYTFVQAPVMSTSTTPTIATQLIPKSYADSLTYAGTSNMDLTTKGIGEEATAAEINAGTQAGGTSAQLVVNPKYLKDSDYYANLPSSDQKAALSGTTSPSVTSKFVTELTASGYQLFSNLTTPTTLGSSDTLYPSQNAVKSYVDTNASIYKNGVVTRAANTATGSQTIAHGLGKIPKYIRITATWYASGMFSPDVSIGVYDGTTTSNDYIISRNDGNGTVNGSAGQSSTNIISLFYVKAGNEANQVATATFDATNITLAWTLTGSMTADNMNIMWEAFA